MRYAFDHVHCSRVRAWLLRLFIWSLQSNWSVYKINDFIPFRKQRKNLIAMCKWARWTPWTCSFAFRFDWDRSISMNNLFFSLLFQFAWLFICLVGSSLNHMKVSCGTLTVCQVSRSKHRLNFNGFVTKQKNVYLKLCRKKHQSE